MTFNFLRSYTELFSKTEVPPRFAIWCGISALHAALERRVWIEQGMYRIYPNSYIILVAASGQKKSTAINLTSKLLRRVEDGPTIISQKITPEALISAIKVTEAEGSKIKTRCGGVLIADELAVFLDRSALERGLGPVLTALYDCTPFEYQTLKRGIDKIDDGYLSILGGTTIELLRSSLPKDAIGGGFTSRTVFVYEDKRAPPVPWIEFDPKIADLEGELITYLEELQQFHGPVTVDKEARAYFERSYRQRYNDTEGFRNDSLMQGYENRRHAHLFKLAMALMMAETPGMTLSFQHIEGANYILEEAEEHMPKVMELITSSDTGVAGNRVLRFITSRNEVSRSELVRKFSNQFDAMELSKILDTLVRGERIEVDRVAQGIVYRIKK